ncbi:MAG: hypothetical protein UY95_C0020G0008 [Parcubacteria group bacterium GW2011_GWA2_56_7]|nr:MAG: hypothetical protein UY95_C0020G0008 [Parcubacteria group bacterium GW2011_GWA2_56_7]
MSQHESTQNPDPDLVPRHPGPGVLHRSVRPHARDPDPRRLELLRDPTARDEPSARPRSPSHQLPDALVSVRLPIAGIPRRRRHQPLLDPAHRAGFVRSMESLTKRHATSRISPWIDSSDGTFPPDPTTDRPASSSSSRLAPSTIASTSTPFTSCSERPMRDTSATNSLMKDTSNSSRSIDCAGTSARLRSPMSVDDLLGVSVERRRRSSTICSSWQISPHS